MLINLSEILSNPAKQLEFHCEIEMEKLPFQGEEYPIVYRSCVNLSAENIGKKKIRLTGGYEVHLLIPCSRCLEDVLMKLPMKIDSVIDYKELSEEHPENLDEMSFMEGQEVDIDLLVYDDLIDALPMKVLCREDCKGLCLVCGKNLNEGACECNRTVEDPRMSAIRDIFKNFKEV